MNIRIRDILIYLRIHHACANIVLSYVEFIFTGASVVQIKHSNIMEKYIDVYNIRDIVRTNNKLIITFDNFKENIVVYNNYNNINTTFTKTQHITYYVQNATHIVDHSYCKHLEVFIKNTDDDLLGKKY